MFQIAPLKYNPKIVLAAWRRAGLPVAVPEHQFHPGRKWAFDFAWPEAMIACEVQGGIWSGGRHTRGAALKLEWEKLNTAAVMGWRIFYCEPKEVTSAGFIRYLKAALLQRSEVRSPSSD